MIPREVFERTRVLLQAQLVRDFVGRELSRGSRAGQLLGQAAGSEFSNVRIDREELVRLHRRLTEALNDAKRERVDAISSRAYLPRNATLANLQSLAANQLTLNAPLELDEPFADRLGLERAVPGTGAISSALDPVTRLSVADQLGPALMRRSVVEPNRDLTLPPPFGDYGPDDPIWLTVALALAWRKLSEKLKREVFNAAPAIGPLQDRARLFIFGDWGTGTERARRVADSIHAKLVGPDSQGRDCHVIHLGDTYVSGWWWEQLAHVIQLWPTLGGPAATSWALAGNHDYYSGVDGYRRLLKNRLFVHQQADGKPTSIFQLSNRHWCVLGLDTSWVDHDLPQEELDWIRVALESAKRRKQKVILLSHHQPWSAFNDGPHPPLWKRVKAFWAAIVAFLRHRHRGATEAPPLRWTGYRLVIACPS